MSPKAQKMYIRYKFKTEAARLSRPCDKIIKDERVLKKCAGEEGTFDWPLVVSKGEEEELESDSFFPFFLYSMARQ